MLTRIRRALTPAEWARAGGLAAAVIGLHVVGFGLLFGVVVPHHFSLGAGGAFTPLASGSLNTPTTARACSTPAACKLSELVASP